MNHDHDPDLNRLGDALRASATVDLAREQRAEDAARSGRRAGFLRRPRVLAGSSLGLAGVAAGLVLALGGSTAAPAFAFSKTHDGSVLVSFSYADHGSLLAADQKLGREYGEDILVTLGRGPATVAGPVNCIPSTTADPGAKTPVRVLLGKNGTSVVPSGSTGAGTVHITSCTLYNGATGGNTGAGNTGSARRG